MKIKISNLQDGEHTYHFEEQPTEFEIDNVNFVKDIIIDVVLYKAANQYNLDIDVSGRYVLPCDRCLEDFETDFHNKFNLIYKLNFSGEDLEGENNGQDDILKFISPNTQYIELKDDIRDYIILSIPMRKVPDEADGVCTYCNRKIDEIITNKDADSVNPVWEKLLKIKKN
jgi:uncharacterized metal-binding protein YceD (DUF177 family)